MKTPLFLSLVTAFALGGILPARADDPQLRNRLDFMRRQQFTPITEAPRRPAKVSTKECPKPCPPEQCEKEAARAKRKR